MWLTIDDGPSEHVRTLVQHLEDCGLSATMFCLGQFLEDRWKDALWMLDRGCEIQNHSFSHPKFRDITEDQCRSEVESTEEILDRLYETAGRTRERRLFRFPFGIQEHLPCVESLGLESVGWQWDSWDWRLAHGVSEAEILDHVRNDPPRDGDIVLMHDHPEKRNLTYRILDLLADRAAEVRQTESG